MYTYANISFPGTVEMEECSANWQGSNKELMGMVKSSKQVCQRLCLEKSHPGSLKGLL